MITGARLREYYLAKGLGSHSELILVFFSAAGEPAPATADLPFCHRIVPVPLPYRYTVGKIVRGLVGHWPLPVVNYMSPEMNGIVSSLLRKEAFDVVHLEGIHMTALMPLVRMHSQAPVVFDWHNIESEVMRRYGARQKSPVHRLYSGITARRLASVEMEMLRDGFGHVVCSERERERLLRIAPEARIWVAENGVDTRYFESPRPTPEGRNRIIFVGSMNYHANIEAAVYFARVVWPGVRKQFPGWRLTLVGSHPAPAVLELKNEPDVEVTGTVADLRPYYHSAVASVVPLHTGGGTRLKILEAMAAGVPVISTPIGAEGLAVSPGVNILFAGREEDWLSHLGSLHREPGLREAVVTAGRELARSRYDWEAIGHSLYETYRGWLKTSR
jgi:glycosyltransferase involved in cell wall biosynthesis